MSDSDHKDKKYVVSSGVNDAKIPRMNPSQVFRSREFFTPCERGLSTRASIFLARRTRSLCSMEAREGLALRQTLWPRRLIRCSHNGMMRPVFVGNGRYWRSLTCHGKGERIAATIRGFYTRDRLANLVNSSPPFRYGMLWNISLWFVKL